MARNHRQNFSTSTHRDTHTSLDWISTDCCRVSRAWLVWPSTDCCRVSRAGSIVSGCFFGFRSRYSTHTACTVPGKSAYYVICFHSEKASNGLRRHHAEGLDLSPRDWNVQGRDCRSLRHAGKSRKCCCPASGEYLSTIQFGYYNLTQSRK